MNTTRRRSARDTDRQPTPAQLPAPHAFPSLVRSTDIRKLWMVRMLVCLGAGEKIFLGRSRWIGLPALVLATLGLDTLGLDMKDEATSAWLLSCLDLTLAAMERRKRPLRFNGTIEANLSLLGKTMRLARADRAILVFAGMLHHDSVLAFVASRTDDSSNTVNQLCEVIGLRRDQVRRAIAPDGVLTRARLVAFRSGGPVDKNVELRRGSFRNLVSTRLASLDALFAGTMTCAPDPTLTRADYPYLEPDFDVILGVLNDALRNRRRGVNLLLYGPPGTGKTELTRTLAAAASTPLYEVGCVDDRGAPENAEGRLANAATAQRLLKGRRALLAFDEIDAIFTDGSAFFGKPTTAAKSKAWVNSLLEGTRTPTFWVANSIDCMDAAFVRRFDIVIEMQAPPLPQRVRMLKAQCGAMLDDARIRRLAQVGTVTPAVMSRAADVVRRARVAGDAQVRLLESLIDNTLTAQGHLPLRQACRGMAAGDYDPALCNASVDLRAMAEAIGTTGMGRLYLYGPPGTGKTAFGHWLSEQLGKPLLQKRVSDIQSPLLGMMEARLARAFEDATRDGAVLQIDEVDSFLRDRRQATRTWQVTQVNEFLTQIESFEGILIASTNLTDGVDPAAMRRFDYKVKLDYLRPGQVAAMLQRMLKQLGLPGRIEARVRRHLEQAESVAPGDFALVRRQHRIKPFASANALATSLAAEIDGKPAARRHRMGFV